MRETKNIIKNIIIARWLKNLIGKSLHYDTCPNCGDSWWWKESGGISYKRNGNAIYEVMICKKCLQNPVRLSLLRIERDLKKLQWDPEDIRLAKTAIITFKVRKATHQI